MSKILVTFKRTAEKKNIHIPANSFKSSYSYIAFKKSLHPVTKVNKTVK